MGWPDHPIFGQGVASATPYQPYEGGPATPKGHQEKKKKKEKNGFGILGVASTTPIRSVWGGHPQNPKTIFPFFFFFLAFQGGQTTPKGLGVASAAPIRPVWGWPATPWPKMGWSDHPIFWARGGSSHPDFFPLFSFFFFKFFISKP
jgi:hypothetical protein